MSYQRGIVDHRIGANYYGPAFDRPCLRQLPRGFVLEETRKPPTDWGRYSLLIILLLVLIAFAQTLRAIA